jgi:hypothetical protein
MPIDRDERRAHLHQRVNLSGGELMDQVTRLIAEGNLRRLVIRRPSGKVMIEVPLTAGIAVGGILTIVAPVLAAVGSMAALVAKVQVDVIRCDDPD